VVPFLLELHATTGDEWFLAQAVAGADYIAAALVTDELFDDSSKTPLGLYEGASGLSYVLELVHRASGRAKYRVAAVRCVEAIKRRTVGGASWGETNDVISGAAGTGLFLLWWARAAHDPSAVTLARGAGEALLARGREASGGTMWRMDSTEPRYLPNFSHGTAGVAYFLATLYRATKDSTFLDAAIAGARHLQAIARRDGDTCTVYHHTDADGTPADLYYLGWCHGPVGTARLFYRLAEVTGDPEWHAWVHRCARGDLTSGIPEVRTPGFWNNVSQCCGNTGVAQFFLDLYRVYGKTEYLAFARRVTEDLMRRATVDDEGVRWVQAENRIEPEKVIAQTGFMQGAAGMGTWLLHLDGFERYGRRYRPVITLPDSPFV
jgi:lantibiotic modifying enzyme